VLQASGQIYLLEPYHRNLNKRLVKSPKLYIIDTGLAAFLLGFDSWEALLRSQMIGALWETHVVLQVVRHYVSRGKSVPLWFWRTAQGAEVDLLIEKGGRFTAVEAKFTEKPQTSDRKGFEALKKFYGENSLIRGWVACRTSRPYELDDTVSAMPTREIARLLDSA